VVNLQVAPTELTVFFVGCYQQVAPLGL